MTMHSDLRALLDELADYQECEVCNNHEAKVTKYVRLHDNSGSMAPVGVCRQCAPWFGSNQRPTSFDQEVKLSARIMQRGWAKPCRALS